jgi:hypothetical protein
MEGGVVGHKFERDPPKDHPCQVWFSMAMSSLTCNPSFSVEFFVQPIYTDYAYFDKRSHLNLFL